MATSTTELILRFRGDSGDLKSTMAQVRAELNQTARTQTTVNKGELSTRQQLAAAQSLQRQRSIALIGQWKQQESAARALATGVRPVGENLQRITDTMRLLGSSIGVLQGPLNGISGRFTSFSTLVRTAGGDLDNMAGSATNAGGAMAALASPIGIVVAAIIAAVAAEALLVKGLFDLAARASDFRGKMFDLAQQTGVSVETLSALEIAAKTTGGSIESIAQSLVIFQGKLDEAQDVSSKAAEKFQELGISTRSTEEAFRDALSVLSAMPEGFNQTNEAAELFGRRGGKQVLAILKELHGDLDGAIKRFREMGILISTEEARAADQFNDQLALLNFQLRAVAATIGKDVVPIALKALQDLSKAIENNREVLNALGKVLGVVASFYGTKLKIGIGIVTVAWLEAKPVLESIAAVYERIAAAARYISGTPPPTVKPEVGGEISAPGLSGTPTDAQIKLRIRALQELVGAQAAAAADSKAIADGAVKDAERAFQRGEITRQQHTQKLLLGLQENRDIELADIKRQRELKLAEFEVAKEGSSERVALINQLAGLDAKERAARNKFDQESKEARARAQEEERKAQAEHEQAKLDIFLEASQNRQDAIKDELARGLLTAEQAAIEEDALENERINRRKANLQKQLQLVGVDPANRQKILDEIAALEVERTEIERRQSERRIAIAREEGESKISLLLADVDRLIELGNISDQKRIASIRAAAAARAKTEEDSVKEILAIRLAAIDREVDAVNVRLTAAKVITDPLARAQQEKELNNQLAILAAERSAIQEDGNRDIEEGREKDLDNERKYASELLSIRRRVVDIQRDTEQARIAVMVLQGVPRKKIIAERAQIEIQAEQDRHDREVASLEAQKQENLESSRTATEQAEFEAELNRQKEAEEARHNQEMIRLKLERDEALRAAGPEGGFLSGLATGQLAEFEKGIQSFADAAVVAFSAVGAAIGGLAQGFGQLIQSWVLLGSQADINIKKMVASVLAGVAAQSAVLAIFELAKGFASLFFNPAEAAAHFQAAALFGSLALVTAVAGRAVAGNSFQTQGAGGEGAGATGTGSTAGAATEPRPVQDINRTPGAPVQGNATLTLQVPDGWFEKEYRKDFNLNGFSRLVLVSGGRTS